MSKRRKKREKDIYEGYEPDGKDLAEWMADTEQDPKYDPEDHCISIQTDIALGK
jgi:hypothetical protein|tara:strand:+ start:581 stop:742 length:162 start_codon:yes stop_codon:yes gene_type:complete